MDWKFRKWQREARAKVHVLRTENSDRALIAVAPGAGKTRLAVSLIADDLAAGIIDCAVVVVPGRALKELWREAFKSAGLIALDDIDNATLEENQARGMNLIDPARPITVVTYHQITAGVGSELFAAMCAQYRVFAVFDEIHHACELADFGECLVHAFSDAVFKLSLSGTPFHTTGSSLAFCRCERRITEDGKVINVTLPDYERSYGEALQASGDEPDDPYVVRPVTFFRWDGRAVLQLQSLTNPSQVTERIIDGHRKADSLGPLLDPSGDYLRKMVQAALRELDETRSYQANAALLITTIDADHCDAVAALVRSCGVNDVVVVRHDIPGAHKILTRFAHGHDRVLVAIKMVAEGVDIKRLRIGLYASDVKTRMYFMQFVGRFIRWDPSLSSSQFATIFIPEHVTLMEYAEEIERMVLESTIPLGDGGDGPEPTGSVVIGHSSDGTMNGAIQHGLRFDADDTDRVLAWARDSGAKNVDLATLMRLHRNRQGLPVMDLEQFRMDLPEPDEGKRNDRLVGRIVLYAKQRGKTEWTYETTNAYANRQAGIPFKNKLTPTAVLVKRREALQHLLRVILSGVDDGSAT